ncbi:MAG: hypothetical protein HC767_12440 [Akkermansiaceae bacterium]|nr:hypothetical protein [Akkermansiaceae bacterium]
MGRKAPAPPRSGDRGPFPVCKIRCRRRCHRRPIPPRRFCGRRRSDPPAGIGHARANCARTRAAP